jgi:hypothetical protein
VLDRGEHGAKLGQVGGNFMPPKIAAACAGLLEAQNRCQLHRRYINPVKLRRFMRH